MIIPTQMKRVPEDGSVNESSLSEDITVIPIVWGFIRDWDAMEDLLHHVLYSGLEWEIGNEGQILFTGPHFYPEGSWCNRCLKRVTYRASMQQSKQSCRAML